MKILLILFLSTNIFSAIMTEEKLIHDDVERTYLKYIPTGYQKNVPINLVIGLHGYSGSASGFEKKQLGCLIYQQKNIILLVFILKVIFFIINLIKTIHLYHHGTNYLLQRSWSK